MRSMECCRACSRRLVGENPSGAAHPPDGQHIPTSRPHAVRRAAARYGPCSTCRGGTAAPRRCAAPATSNWCDEVLSCCGATLRLTDHDVVKHLWPTTNRLV